MEARISKWGNSLGVRIPLSVATTLGMGEDTTVDLNIKNNEIVIAKKKAYKLDVLLSKITAKNKHQEIETGAALGKEIW